jgi:hypothetical protein
MPFVDYKPCPPCEPIRVFVPDKSDEAGPVPPAAVGRMAEEAKAAVALRLCVCRRCPRMGGERAGGTAVKCLAVEKKGCSSCQTIVLASGKCPENRWPVELPDGLRHDQDSAGNDGCGCAE